MEVDEIFNSKENDQNLEESEEENSEDDNNEEINYKLVQDVKNVLGDVVLDNEDEDDYENIDVSKMNIIFKKIKAFFINQNFN